MDIPYETEERLRQAFKYLNRFMVLMFRLGLGGWGNGNRYVGYIMVLNHKGRKTGLQRRTPVNFTRLDDAIYCTAGFGARSDWYRNILAEPNVEIWLPRARFKGLATDVSQEGGSLERLRKVLAASGFAAPLFGLRPERLSSEDLEHLLESYRLIRIDQLQPLTGAKGPGELAWVWPLATMILLGLVLGRSVRRTRRVEPDLP